MIKLFNNVKTAMLLAAMYALLIFIGGQFGRGGLLMGLILGGAGVLISYFFSHKIAVAAMRGVEVFGDTPGAGGQVYHMVDELRMRADLPMPRVYICPQDAPNAFATGRSPGSAAVAVTQGALRLLSPDELRGVLGHELSHVRNYDTLTSCVAAMVGGILSYFAQFGLMFGGLGGRRDSSPNPLAIVGIVLAPLAAALLRAMISRSREFVADADGAKIAGTPDGLISALRKLEMVNQRVPMETHNPSMNSMFIVEPFLGGVARMFASHPPTEKRIAALMTLRQGVGSSAGVPGVGVGFGRG